MPILFRWLGRNAAMHCYGTIEFFDYENCIPVFSDPMPLRWADSKEPMTFLQLSHGQLKKVFDPTKFSSAEYCNVYPGSNEPIDVVAKFDVDEECYGWSNMNYLPDKTWRNKDWELRKMKYLVHVKVYTNGESKDALYVLDNTVLRCDCKLVEASKKDKARMK